jgi:hypothetical protein
VVADVVPSSKKKHNRGLLRLPLSPVAPLAGGWGLRVRHGRRRGLFGDTLRSPRIEREELAVTDKAAFSEAEWMRIKRAPFVAGMAISFADPGGPIELAKETAATLRTVVNAGDRGAFVGAVAREAEADARAHQNPLKDFKPRGALATTEILEELKAVNAIVSEKAGPEEAEAYRTWLRDAAREAADAAKEGGFFGFHAVRVSEGEQRMLDTLDEALRPPASPG